MSRTYSLAYLTAAHCTPPQAIDLAARIGCDFVGLRLLPAFPGGDVQPLMSDPALVRETKARMAATGARVFDVEIVRIGPDFRAADCERFLATAAELGARAVLTGNNDAEDARFIANYAAFCDIAAPYGLTADLEFMPWTATPNCNTARRQVEAAGRPNGRILVDALHVARSATSLADLAALPRNLVSYVQVCDAPAGVPTTTEGLLFTARQARLLPGEGSIDIAGMLAAMPGDLPVSIEIPNLERAPQVGHDAWAVMGLEAARRLAG